MSQFIDLGEQTTRVLALQQENNYLRQQLNQLSQRYAKLEEEKGDMVKELSYYLAKTRNLLEKCHILKRREEELEQKLSTGRSAATTGPSVAALTWRVYQLEDHKEKLASTHDALVKRFECVEKAAQDVFNAADRCTVRQRSSESVAGGSSAVVPAAIAPAAPSTQEPAKKRRKAAK